MKPLKTRNYFPTEPWNQPLGRRLRQLASDQTAGFMINVYLYEKPDASTFRYRVYNMAKALETGSSWRAAFFFADELEQIQDLILDCQLLTLVRFRWTFALENLVQAAGSEVSRSFLTPTISSLTLPCAGADQYAEH